MALSAVIRDLADRWPVLAAGVVALCTAPSAGTQIRTADRRFEIEGESEQKDPDGVDDWRSRRTLIRVAP